MHEDMLQSRALQGKKVKDEVQYSPIVYGWKGLIDEYHLGSLGEINLTQIKGRNFHFVLIGIDLQMECTVREINFHKHPSFGVLIDQC